MSLKFAPWLCCVLLVLLTRSSTPALAESSKEYQIKAAFLFNFSQFVEWPSSAFPSAETPFCIGILGDDPFGSALEETVKGEKANNRSISVQRSSQLDALKSCQIIFISRSEKGKVNEIVSTSDGQPIVTVSEIEGFARRGGVINFYLESGKVRFEINPAVAKNKGLKMSSQLLKLGKLVEASKEAN